MALRQPHPSLPATLRAVALAIALAAMLVAPAGAARPDTTGDPDGDGLTNTEEAFWGGDRKDADTDNDGLSDGDEVRRYFTSVDNPDSDDDGLTDGFEVRIGTLPYDADTDNDGYFDGEDDHPTNPRRH